MGRGFDANGDTYNDFPMPTELAAVGGVDGMAFTGAGPRRTQMINLYSTIGPGMEMPFADVYGPNVTPAMDEAFWSKIAFVTEVETLHRQAAAPLLWWWSGNLRRRGRRPHLLVRDLRD